MRGIFSLGAIGLMTSASVMVAAPMSAAAVTPLDLVSQQISEFPESVVGSPTMSEGDEIAAPDQTTEAGTVDTVSEPAGEPIDAVQEQTTAGSRQSLADSLRQSLLSNGSENDASPEGETAVEEQTADVTTDAAEISTDPAGETTAEGDETSAAQSTEAASASETSSVTGLSGVDVDSMLETRLSELVTGAENEPGFDAAAQTTAEFQSAEGTGGGGQAPDVPSGAESDDLLAAAPGDAGSGTNGNIGLSPLGNSVEDDEESAVDTADTGEATDGQTAEAVAGGAAESAPGDATAAGETTADAQPDTLSTVSEMLEARLRELTGTEEATAVEPDAAAGDETVDAQAGEPAGTEDAEAGAQTDAAAAGGVPAAGETVPANDVTANVTISGISTANAFVQARLNEIITGADETSAPAPGDETIGVQAGDVAEAPNVTADGQTGDAAAAGDVPVSGDAASADDATVSDFEPRSFSTADQLLETQLQGIVTGSEDATETGVPVAEDGVSDLAGGNAGAADSPVQTGSQNAAGDDAVTTAPEPATWIMMILGFWMAAWRLRRKNGAVSQSAPA